MDKNPKLFVAVILIGVIISSTISGYLFLRVMEFKQSLANAERVAVSRDAEFQAFKENVTSRLGELESPEYTIGIVYPVSGRLEWWGGDSLPIIEAAERDLQSMLDGAGSVIRFNFIFADSKSTGDGALEAEGTAYRTDGDPLRLSKVVEPHDGVHPDAEVLEMIIEKIRALKEET